MLYQQFSRSQALSNIPAKKLSEKLTAVIQACKTCSEKKNKQINKESKFNADGLCERCSLLSIAYNRYAESNIPVEYWDLDMDRDFKGEQILMKRYTQIVNNLQDVYKSGLGVCFAGSHGCGKTLTSTSILKKASQKNYLCLYSTLSDIVSVLTLGDSFEKFSARKELMVVDFLVIDEFDPRFMPSENAADLFGRTLEGIFRTRAQNKLPTIMCTNSPNVVESFTGPIKQSIESLMKGYMKIVPVIGADFRKSR